MNSEPIFISSNDSDLTLQCKVKGKPFPKLTWLINGRTIHPSDDLFKMLDNNQFLKIKKIVKKKTEGKYTCQATSRAGEAQATQMVHTVQIPQFTRSNLLDMK